MTLDFETVVFSVGLTVAAAGLYVIGIAYLAVGVGILLMLVAAARDLRRAT